MHLYDEALLAKLPDKALNGSVASLCRGKTPEAVAAAALIEGWVDRFGPPGKCIADLKSPDDSSFRSAWWELAVASGLAHVGFDVDLRFRLPDGKTPDIVAQRDGLRTMVEVFVVGDDDQTRRERDLLDATAQAIRSRVTLPPGLFVSMSALKRLSAVPSGNDLDVLAAAFQRWLDGSPLDARFEHMGGLPVHASGMTGDPEPYLSLTGLGGALAQSGRIRDRLRDKIDKYAPAATSDLRLTLAVCEGSWKVTEHQTLAALYGQEKVEFKPSTGETVRAFYDGTGAAVPGGPNGAAGAAAFAGAWYLSRGLLRVDPPGCELAVSFAHSPYCSDPIPAGSLRPFPEHQVHGGSLRWVGDRHPITLA